MKDKESRILFLDDQGREIEFMVLEQTTLAGTNYLLVADSVEEDGTVFDYERNLTGGGLCLL